MTMGTMDACKMELIYAFKPMAGGGLGRSRRSLLIWCVACLLCAVKRLWPKLRASNVECFK